MPALDPEGVAGFDPNGVEGFDPEGVAGFDPEGVPGFDPNGVPAFDPDGVPGLETTGVFTWPWLWADEGREPVNDAGLLLDPGRDLRSPEGGREPWTADVGLEPCLDPACYVSK